jgi:hypothetical protein
LDIQPAPIILMSSLREHPREGPSQANAAKRAAD